MNVVCMAEFIGPSCMKKFIILMRRMRKLHLLVAYYERAVTNQLKSAMCTCAPVKMKNNRFKVANKKNNVIHNGSKCKGKVGTY